MKRVVGVVSFLLALVGCVTIEDRLVGALSPQDVVQATADYYVNDIQDDSCAVAYVTTNRVVYGLAGAAHEHSLFRLASLTKLFLHPIVLDFDAKGLVELDRPVTAYSKLDLPPEYGAVTLRDLLENRSGLPREFMIPGDPWDTWLFFHCGFTGSHIYTDFDTREKFEKKAWRPWWRRCLRHKREIYSNVGFGLLGMVLEDARGQSLETLLREGLVRPSGLMDTTFEPEPHYTNRLTRACAGQIPWTTGRGCDVPDNRLGSALRATGGGFSSISDCARFFSSYWAILDANMRERSIDAYEDDAVFGLLRVKILPSGRRVLYRSGMIYGGSSFVGFDPVDRSIVIILRNVTSWPDTRGFVVLETLQTAK